MQSFSSNFQTPNYQEIQWDDRCHVIKLLQEQVNNLMNYKNDYEQMKKRAELAERLLDMRESEIKIKFDELEQTFRNLEEENERLKVQLAKGIKRTLPEINIGDEVSTENKWKIKYKALSKTTDNNLDSGINNDITKSQELIKLQTQIEELQNENRQKNENIKNLSEELQKSSSEAKQARDATNKALKRVSNLEAEKNVLLKENTQLKETSKQKAVLLQHSRNKQEKNIKNQKKSETNFKDELEDQKKKYISQVSEVARLTNALENEAKMRKQAERKILKMKKSKNALEQSLQESLKKTEDENKKLHIEINNTRSEYNSINIELNKVKIENTQLQNEISNADKIKKNNVKLESTIVQMQQTIDNMHSRISSAESNTHSKIEELKNLTIKHWGGEALTFEWSDCIKFIDAKFNFVKAQEQVIKNLEIQNNKLQKENKKIHNKLMSNIETLSQLQSAQSDSMAIDIKHHHNATHDYDPFNIINQFRHALTRRINKFYFENEAGINIVFNSIMKHTTNGKSLGSSSMKTQEEEEKNDNNTYSPSLRCIILFSIFIQKWKSFKKEDPSDKGTILEYTIKQSRNSQSKINIIQSKIDLIFNHLKQQTAQVGILTKANYQLTNKLETTEKEIQRLHHLAKVNQEYSEEIEKKVKFYESKCQQMIELHIHENIKQQLQAQVQENTKLEEQTNSLKSEIKKLLDSLDSKHHELSKMQNSMLSITEENEDLKQHLNDVNHELNLAQTALKERTRELLSLEREIMKQKKNYVVVKDTIPLTPQINKSKIAPEFPSNCKFLTDAIRGGLAQMQSKILKSDDMI